MSAAPAISINVIEKANLRGGTHATTRIVEICWRDGAGCAIHPCRARGQATVKVGVVGAKTGPLAPGAAATFFPPWQLWAHEVNQAGGLKLKDGARKVELIEYDDHTQPAEAIKALERLATIDKADWIVGLYSHRLQHRRGADIREARLSANRRRLRH